MKRFIPGLVTVLLVIALGLGISGLAVFSLIPNPTFSATYQVDLAGLASRLGIFFGGEVLIVFLTIWFAQRKIAQKQI